MFAGIVRGTGQIAAVERFTAGCHLAVEHGGTSLDLSEGDSVAVDGVCLTALKPAVDCFQADVSAETLRRTTLGRRQVGELVNLEPSLRLQDGLGGHLVQGHVDATGLVLERRAEGSSEILRIQMPASVGDHCVHKGSVAVNGVSLTISELSSAWIEVTIIPHTSEVTSLSHLRVDDEVNLEADLVSKYVEKHLLRFLAHSDSGDCSD